MKRNIIYLLLPALLLGACDSNEDWGPDTGGRSGEPIRFEIGFAPTGGSWTRAATGADFKTVWETGDEIGLFAVKAGETLQALGNSIHHLKVTFDGTDWNGAHWPNDENKNEHLDFYAYYPYDAGMIAPTYHTFSVKADQRDETNYNRSDVLLAQAANVTKGTAVSLQFSHALSLVQVEVKREVNVPHFDDDLTVTLTDVLTDAPLDWTGAPAGAGRPSDIVMHKVADMENTYRALVPAQTMPVKSKVTFVQTTTGNEIDMEYQGVQNAPLTAGAAHKYSVTLGWGIDPDHIYDVGDRYPHVGPTIGIVYEVTNGGKNGKVVGLDELTGVPWVDTHNWNIEETNATNQTNGRANMYTISNFIAAASKNWSNFPVFDWVHTIKNGGTVDYNQTDATDVWYLPALNELQALYSAYDSYGKADFNDRLTDAGGTGLSNSYHWSSSEDDDTNAYVVSLNHGYSGYTNKSVNYRARCVLAF